MSADQWIQKETIFQHSFDDIKVEYKPCTTLSVTVLRGRNISVNFLHDLVDIPDPQVYVSCKTAVGHKEFKTKIARDQPNPEWNETFTFILPDSSERHIIEIEAYDEDRFMFDPFLGSASIDAGYVDMDKAKTMSLDFGKHGEIDVRLLKQYRTSPDLRLSLSLCQEERDFRISRKPKTMKALQAFLGMEKGPSTLEETPTIGMAITGGGYRALATSCGVMEALEESDLFNCLMYIAGLSGSSWYLSTAYTHQVLKNLETKTHHHDWLRSQMENSLWNYLFDISFYKRYRKYSDFKKSHHQPTTFVDFYGLTLGETFLGVKRVDTRLSELRDYVKTSNVPFPILACAHVRDHLAMNEFWEEVEMTPFEVSVPCYGINIPTDKFNSSWGNGILQQRLPEPPLHYLMGTSGSAFAITWDSVGKKNEISDNLWEYIVNIQQKKPKKSKKGDNSSSSDTDDDSDDDYQTECGGVESAQTSKSGKKNFAASKDDYWLERVEQKAKQTSNKKEDEVDVEHGLSKRGILLKRTAKVKNCAFAHQSLMKFCMNALRLDLLGDAAGRFRRSMSTRKNHISLCDAALGCNLPSIHLLRPQRTADVLLIVDCSNYIQENMLMMELFGTVEKQVRDHGVKFPRINLDEIAKDPFREFYIFEDENDPECPVVFWFTLANGKFKTLTNPHRRPGFPKPDAADSGKEKFNDFSIFPETSDFGTLKTSLSPLNFDRIRELIRFNIMSNMWIVKEKIANRVQMMRKGNSD